MLMIRGNDFASQRSTKTLAAQCKYINFEVLPNIKLYQYLHCVVLWSDLREWAGVKTKQAVEAIGIENESIFRYY